MDVNEYQQQVRRTMGTFEATGLFGYTLGLCGESGEVAEHIKKWGFHGKELDHEYLEKELGDVLWYVTALASLLGLNLSQILQANIEKLQRRYPTGFVDGGGER